MQIFFDLDDVLFYTDAFTKDFKTSMCSALRITPQQFDKSYKQAREREGIQNYSFQRHADILVEEYHLARNDVDAVVDTLTHNTEKYVFADVRNVLEELQKKGHELFLVTFGSQTIQEKKIAGSGLAAYFQDVKIGEIDKAQAIEDLQREHGKTSAVYAEDRIDHVENVCEKHPDMEAIIFMRPEGRYTEQTPAHENFDQYEHVTNMNELKEKVAEHVREQAREKIREMKFF